VPTGRIYNLRHKIFTGPTVQALPDLIRRPLSSTTEVQHLHSRATACRSRFQPVDATLTRNWAAWFSGQKVSHARLKGLRSKLYRWSSGKRK